VHQRYGGAKAWALAAGVPPQSLSAMSTLLLEASE
jgi:hypothetical protein